MLEGVSPSLVQGISAIGLLLLILVTLIGAVWKGLIYTRPQVNEILDIQKGRVEDAKEREGRWQSLAEKWQQTAQEAIANNEADLEQGKTIIALLESVKAAQRSPRR